MACLGRIRSTSIRRAASCAVVVVIVAASCTLPATDTGLHPTLASIQTKVFDVHCAVANCHRGPAPESQMSLEVGRAYDNLVNVRSVGLRDMYRVIPGRADSSYLIRKLTGEGIVGDRMPLSSAALPDSVVATIKTWINSGAHPE